MDVLEVLRGEKKQASLHRSFPDTSLDKRPQGVGVALVGRCKPKGRFQPWSLFILDTLERGLAPGWPSELSELALTMPDMAPT